MKMTRYGRVEIPCPPAESIPRRRRIYNAALYRVPEILAWIALVIGAAGAKYGGDQWTVQLLGPAIAYAIILAVIDLARNQGRNKS